LRVGLVVVTERGGWGEGVRRWVRIV